MAGGFRCSRGHDWLPPTDGSPPDICPVCGGLANSAADATESKREYSLASQQPTGQAEAAAAQVPTLPGDLKLPPVHPGTSPTQTLPPAASSDTPQTTREFVSFSSLVGMPQGTGSQTNFDPGSMVPFGDGTIDFTPPPAVPGFEILQELGRGGMGVVYKARQVNLNRAVALKMILAGNHAGPKERERFRREAEAVATLQNPNIVQIFEIGEASGHLYLALEYVEGGSLAQHLKGVPWAAREAAQLVELLARAVQYAHDQGVVHRDLKPGNVLIGRADPGRSGGEDGWPSEGAVRRTPTAMAKITDFGLAKRLGDSANPDGTKTGAVMGTPSYIAPEQASGKSRDVGPAADVYSLGAILYELLTGRPPFLGETPLDTVLQVLHDDPVPLKRLQPTIPRDLETICLKCLHKSVAKRYASAEALADDLQRFLRGEPIRARPLSPWGRSVKWARRHPSLAVLGLVTVAATIALVAVLSVAYSQVKDAVNQREQALEKEAAERRRVEELAADIERKRREAADLARDNENRRAEAVRQNLELQRQIEERRRTTYALQLAKVAALCERDPMASRQLLDDQRFCPLDLRDFTWAYLRRLCQREELVYTDHQPRDAQLPADPIRAVAFSPTGTFVATAGNSGQVRVWDPRTGLTWAVLVGHQGSVRGVAFSTDGEVIATAGADGTIRFWELPVAMLDGARKSLDFIPGFRPLVKPLALAPTIVLPDAHSSEVNCLAFSPNGRYLVSGGEDGVLRWWGLAPWRVANPSVAVVGGASAAAAVLGEASRSVRAVRLDRETIAHYVDIGGNIEPRAIRSLAFAATGSILVTGGADRAARVWKGDGSSQMRYIANHDATVESVAATPDGKIIASVNNNEAPSIRLINVETGRDIRRLVGHTKSIYSVVISPDGELLASGGFDWSVRIWDFDGQERTVLLGHEQAISSLAFAPDRRTLVSAGMDATAHVWQTTARTHDAVSIAPRDEFSRDASIGVCALATGRHGFDPTTFTTGIESNNNRSWVQVYRSDIAVRARRGPWHLTTLPPIPLPPRSGPIMAEATSPDGTVVLAATGKTLYLWRLLSLPRSWRADPDLPPRMVQIPIPKPIYAMAVDPTGSWLASLDADGVRMWDLHKLLVPAKGPAAVREPRLILAAANLRALAIHPEGEWIAVSGGGRVQLIDRRGTPVADVSAGPESQVESIAFGGKDGRLLAVGDASGQVKVWELSREGTPTLVSNLTGHSGSVSALAFSPDSTTLAVGGYDRTVSLWDPIGGQERATLTGHTDRVVLLRFLPDSSGLISVGRDGGVKRWRADRGPGNVPHAMPFKQPAIGGE